MISLGKLILSLGLTSEDSITLVEQQRDAVLQFLEQQTGRYFGPVEIVDERIPGSGTRDLWLSEPAITSVGSEAITVTEDTDNTLTLLTAGASDGYAVRQRGHEGVIVRLGGARWDRDADYVVHYSRGYEEDGLPKDIEQLVLDLIKLRRSMHGKEAVISESIGGYSYSRPAIYNAEDGELKMIPGAYQTVRSWRRLVIA